MLRNKQAVLGLHFRKFLPSDAEAMISWRYPAPYSEYNLDPEDKEILAALLRPGNNYHAILRESEMIGFFCWGADARVPGWVYDNVALDLGMGLRPDLTGKGQGHIYLNAVLAEVRRQQQDAALRATIVAWNERAIHMCVKTGFRILAQFKSQGAGGQEYVVLVRAHA